jgi:hypothetical protein
MKRRAFIKMGIAVSTLPALRAWTAEEASKKAHWPFYAFDNGVGRGTWTPEKQAALLKELGYDGMAYNFTTNKDLESWLKIYDEAKLGICSLYIHTFAKLIFRYTMRKKISLPKSGMNICNRHLVLQLWQLKKPTFACAFGTPQMLKVTYSTNSF